MIRQIALSALLAAGAATGLALTPAAASADPPGHGQHHRARYEVLVRHGRHWDVYRTVEDRGLAERIANRLEHRGLDTRVRRVGGWDR